MHYGPINPVAMNRLWIPKEDCGPFHPRSRYILKDSVHGSEETPDLCSYKVSLLRVDLFRSPMF